MLLPQPNVRYTNGITHEGKTLLFVTTADGYIYYTIRQDGFEDNFNAARPWEDWKELLFAEEDDDPSVVAQEKQTQTSNNKEQTFIVRSCYRTTNGTAVAPIQLISGAGYLHVFRQSKSGTLLVDRYVLDGMTNTLVRKFDVRYKRSRQRYKPIQSTRSSFVVDSLDFRDRDDNLFYEPTIELCFINGIKEGAFAVVLVQTAEHDVFRWHIFATRSDGSGKSWIDAYSVRLTDEQVFEVHDPLSNGTLTPDMCGIIHRKIVMSDYSGLGAPTATLFNTQYEQLTQTGLQLLKGETRLMLAVPVAGGHIASVNFAVAIDGTLSEISTAAAPTTLSSKSRDLMLSANITENIRAYAPAVTPMRGTIQGLERQPDGIAVQITSPEAKALDGNTSISIQGTSTQDGYYTQITPIDAYTLEIVPPNQNGQVGLGEWEVVVPDDAPEIAEGMITGVQQMPNGTLRITTALEHCLEEKQAVQVSGTIGYDGIYELKKLTDHTFTIPVRWQNGELINLRLIKRRGLTLDGVDDYVSTPLVFSANVLPNAGFGETLSAWVQVSEASAGRCLIVGRDNGMIQLLVVDGRPAVAVIMLNGEVLVKATDALPLNQWVHLATIVEQTAAGVSTIRLLRDGVVINEQKVDFQGKVSTPPSLLVTRFNGKDGFVKINQPQDFHFGGTDSFSIAAWVYPLGTGIIFSKYNREVIGGVFLSIAADQAAVLHREVNPFELKSAAKTVPFGRWSHIAATYDGKTARVYINGALTGTLDLGTQVADLQTLPLIGAWHRAHNPGEFFNGYLAELSLWNVVRTPNQIQYALNQRLSGKEAGLISYWNVVDGKLVDSVSPERTANTAINGGVTIEYPPSALHATEAAKYFIGGSPTQGAKFKGRISDVQVWDIPRLARHVCDSMHLTLTGREMGLRGQWRFEAISEGSERLVADFGPDARNATVYGDAYISDDPLRRKLANGSTPIEADRYANATMVAVTQRARYRESFEFRIEPVPAQFNPAAIAKDTPIFQIRYWGRNTQFSEEKIDMGTATPGFTALKDGWFLASGDFSVPEGVNWVRSFEIVNVRGQWEQMALRRQRLEMISDTISEVLFNDQIVFDTTVKDLAAAEPRQNLRKLKAIELKIQTWLARKYSLQARYDALSRIKNPTVEIDAKKRELEIKLKELGDLEKLRNQAKERLESEKANPINYWCLLHLEAQPNGYVQLENARLTYFPRNAMVTERAYFRFMPTGDGWYEIQNKSSSGAVYIPVGWDGIALDQNNPGVREWQQWQLQKVAGTNGSFLRNRRSGAVIAYVQREYEFMASRFHAVGEQPNPNYRFFIEKVAELGPANGVINEANTPYEKAEEDFNTKQKEVSALQLFIKDATDRATTMGLLETEIQQINAQIDGVQTEFNTLNNALLAIVKNPGLGLSMKTLPPDRRGLITEVALLKSLAPKSRVRAMETSDGNVQLSYFDEDGCIRMTNYDATSDSRNTTADQWLPNAFQACLSFASKTSMVKLDTPIHLGENWTIEVWFQYPFTQNTPQPYPLSALKQGLLNAQPALKGSEIDAKFKDWFKLSPDTANVWRNTLISTTTPNNLNTSRHISIITVAGRSFLGMTKNNDAYILDYDCSTLAYGWHHLAVVGRKIADNKGATTFYLNGEPIGQPIPVKLDTPINMIGNFTSSEPGGWIGDVRVWGIALSPAEIAANHLSPISGNEPGLVAYYPMSEAGGAILNDQSPNNHNGKIEGAAWFAASIPYGNPGYKVMRFDGNETRIELPSSSVLNVANNTSRTWMIWVKSTYNTDLPRIFSKLSLTDVANGNGYFVGIDSISGKIGATFFAKTLNTASFVASTKSIIDGAWHHIALVLDAAEKKLHLYVDGVREGSNGLPTGAWNFVNNLPLSLGYGSNATTHFRGHMANFRVWERALSADDIKQAMYQRAPIAGTAIDLPLNQLTSQTASTTTLGTPQVVHDNTLPIVGDAVVCSEYGAFILDATGQRTSMLRRFIAMTYEDGVWVVPEKRLEELELQWVGNAQFKPTLLGYIEGAPPVPSENLTVLADYNNATSVELTTSDEVSYSWSYETSGGKGGTGSLFFGVDSLSLLFTGATSEQILSTHYGGRVDMSAMYTSASASNVEALSSFNTLDRLTLRGAPELKTKFPKLGQRFVPKNIGYALVVSSTADVFITRLKRSGRMISYEILPNADIPPDVNTITFLINPAYTMNGSLDGMTGTKATSDVYFRDVPAMRTQFGSLYPASYFRVKEAYDLKQQIERLDLRRQSYFENFNSRLNDLGSLGREINNQAYNPDDVTVNQDVKADDGSGTSSEVVDPASELSASAEQSRSQLEQLGRQRQAEVSKRFQDNAELINTTSKLRAWQKRMEDLLIRAGKRNIVNTYVWDADGGWRAQEESFASTVEHMVGSSFSMDMALGFEGDFTAFTVDFSLTAQATLSLSQTISKIQRNTRTMALTVDLSGMEFLGITDYNDQPMLPGEKVNRYRFMSFYLDGSTSNFHDFFNSVVDPQWLQGNGEEARALRQVMGTKPGKPWRVLHRVTYIERPALVGFGKDTRTAYGVEERPWWFPWVGSIQEVVDRLEVENQDLKQKLDQILELLRPS